MAALGYTIALIDIFLRSSRVLDVFAPGLRIPLIVMAVGMLLAVATGRIMEPLTSRLGLLLIGFTAFMFLGGAVGLWPGGTFAFLLRRWIPVLPVFFVGGAFLRSAEHVQRAAALLGIGFLSAAAATLVFGKEVGFGRAAADMTYGNSNDLAMICLFGAPPAIWLAAERSAGLLVRLAPLGLLAASAPVFVRSGSRAGILVAGIVGVYLLFRLPPRARVQFLIAAAVILPLGLALTPQYILDRYATLAVVFFSAPDPIADDAPAEDEHRPDRRNVGSAIGSAEGRFELLKQSIEVTLQNPILGVGAGMFMVAENELAVDSGLRRGSWHVSHNMYTEVSSETGLVGFALWISIVISTWRTFSRAEKLDPRLSPAARQLRSIAFPLRLSLLVYLLFGVTLSMALNFFLVVLATLAMRMDVLMRSLRPAAPSPADAWPARPSRAPDRTPEAIETPIGRRQVRLPGSLG